ncbi:MAG: hypothetical protein ACKO5X_08060, partial [Limnohabitans sp.]
MPPPPKYLALAWLALMLGQQAQPRVLAESRTPVRVQQARQQVPVMEVAAEQQGLRQWRHIFGEPSGAPLHGGGIIGGQPAAGQVAEGFRHVA